MESEKQYQNKYYNDVERQNISSFNFVKSYNEKKLSKSNSKGHFFVNKQPNNDLLLTPKKLNLNLTNKNLNHNKLINSSNSRPCGLIVNSRSPLRSIPKENPSVSPD